MKSFCSFFFCVHHLYTCLNVTNNIRHWRKKASWPVIVIKTVHLTFNEVNTLVLGLKIYKRMSYKILDFHCNNNRVSRFLWSYHLIESSITVIQIKRRVNGSLHRMLFTPIFVSSTTSLTQFFISTRLRGKLLREQDELLREKDKGWKERQWKIIIFKEAAKHIYKYLLQEQFDSGKY